MNKLIKIKENYYVIDDSEIKKDDWYLNTSSNTFHKSSGTEVFDYRKGYQVNFKITHSTQEGIGEQLNLNDIEELVNGYSVENLAESSNGYALYGKPLGEKYLAFKEGFLSGFEKQKELSKDKLFTVEDIRTIFTHRKQLGLTITGNIRNGSDQPDKENWFNESIKLLLPPTEWNIEFQNGKIILV